MRYYLASMISYNLDGIKANGTCWLSLEQEDVESLILVSFP